MTVANSGRSHAVAERAAVNRSHSEVRQRSQVIGVRVTDEERARYQQLADKYGKTLPDLLRLCVEAALIEGDIHAR